MLVCVVTTHGSVACEVYFAANVPDGWSSWGMFFKTKLSNRWATEAWQRRSRLQTCPRADASGHLDHQTLLALGYPPEGYLCAAELPHSVIQIGSLSICHDMWTLRHCLWQPRPWIQTTQVKIVLHCVTLGLRAHCEKEYANFYCLLCSGGDVKALCRSSGLAFLFHKKFKEVCVWWCVALFLKISWKADGKVFFLGVFCNMKLLFILPFLKLLSGLIWPRFSHHQCGPVQRQWHKRTWFQKLFIKCKFFPWTQYQICTQHS